MIEGERDNKNDVVEKISYGIFPTTRFSFYHNLYIGRFNCKDSDKIKLLEKCDICGKNVFFHSTLTCKICGKKVCSGHSSEQYSKDTSVYVSFNYPDGESFKEEDFLCYHCRTGNIPEETHKPRPTVFKTKRGIAVFLIIMLILSFSAWYSYGYFTRDTYMEVEGYYREKTSESFLVEDKAEVILAEYSSDLDDPELMIRVYDSDSDELVGNIRVEKSTSGRTGENYYLSGDTTLFKGEYYLVITENDGHYKLKIIEKII